MYGVKDITAMRKSGRLEEAYEMAQALREADPGEWADMALFWVLRDMVGQLLNTPTDEGRVRAQDLLTQMESLQRTMKDDKNLGKPAIMKLRRMLSPHASDMAACSELAKTDPLTAFARAITIAGPKGEHLEPSLHEELGWIHYRYLRAKGDQLAPREGPTVLWEYLCLKNKRPSFLHSVMLGQAVTLHRLRQDFSFSGFLQHWDPRMLRREDLQPTRDGNGGTFPSLLSRVCDQLAQEGTPLIEELAEGAGCPPRDIADMQRKRWFWTLYNIKKEEGWSGKFAQAAMTYAMRYGQYEATHWHLEILSLVARDFDASRARFLLDFLRATAEVSMGESAWRRAIGSDGKSYPPYAVTFAKACYEALKSLPPSQRDPDLIATLSRLYDEMESHRAGDEWTARHRAFLSLWSGDVEDASERFRQLLLVLGTNYYVWREAAESVSDPTIKIGLLLHALELQRDDKFVGPIKLDLAELLIGEGYAADARKYLREYVAFRQKEGMQVDARCLRLQQLAQSGEDGRPDRYDKKQAVTAAMEYVYSDYQWEDFVVVSQYENKGKESKGKERVKLVSGDRSFSIRPGQLGIGKRSVPLGIVVRCRCIAEEATDQASEEGVRLRPLMMKVTDQPLWSTLPEEVGCIYRLNKEKRIASIASPDGDDFVLFNADREYKPGDCLTFRYFYECVKGERRARLVSPTLSDSLESILERFSEGVAVVDNVNPKKSLFHILLRNGCDMVRDRVIHYSETELRPEIGDSLKIRYAIIQRGKRAGSLIPVGMEKTDEVDESLIMQYSGALSLKYMSSTDAPDFAFVDDIYVPRYLLDDQDFADGDMVSGRAVYSDRGGFRAIELAKQ